MESKFAATVGIEEIFDIRFVAWSMKTYSRSQTSSSAFVTHGVAHVLESPPSGVYMLQQNRNSL